MELRIFTIGGTVVTLHLPYTDPSHFINIIIWEESGSLCRRSGRGRSSRMTVVGPAGDVAAALVVVQAAELTATVEGAAWVGESPQEKDHAPYLRCLPTKT